MIQTWLYLLTNRERPQTLSRATKLVAKRIMTFPSLLYLSLRPVATRMRGAKIGTMSVLGQSSISGNLKVLSIGDQCSLGRCEIAVFAPLTIGSRVVINDGARLLTASHDVESSTWERVELPIVIDDYAWIATGATILPGVHIGRGAVVGADAVVSRSIPAGAICGGNPARILTKKRTQPLRYNPTALLAPFEAWLGPSSNLD